ncbi:MAG TPA: diaminopimelate epimerase [Stellaceae bacterium]|nr:diaminopimelate epimerase [Stellaceae bacterium]
MQIAFLKMHGLGNDFVVLDARGAPIALDAAAARVIADRHTGIGCDQIVVVEAARRPETAAYMRIVNADGSEAAACGNATRCVARLIAEETGAQCVRLDTAAGMRDAAMRPDGRVAVDMGEARTGWRSIPLARETDTLEADVAAGPLRGPVCTNIGNPHATFFVADAAAIDLSAVGPLLEHDKLFPERANIGVATVEGADRIRLRVWERGAGITRACGTGACAALVAAHRRGLAGRCGTVALDGGELDIAWRRDDGHVIMTGPAEFVFAGRFDAALLGR